MLGHLNSTVTGITIVTDIKGVCNCYGSVFEYDLIPHSQSVYLTILVNLNF